MNPLRAKFQALSETPAPAAKPPVSSAPSVTPIQTTIMPSKDTALAMLRAKLSNSQARVNPPEAKIADDALTPKVVPTQEPAPTVTSGATPAPVATNDAKGTKHTRRTKAEMEAARSLVSSVPVAAAEPSVTAFSTVSGIETFSTEVLLREVFRRIRL